MSKYDERIKARLMRKEGISIIVIAKELSVSKSTVSGWCRDIILTEEQIEKLKAGQKISWTRGQIMGAEANKNKRLTAKSLIFMGKKLLKKYLNESYF